MKKIFILLSIAYSSSIMAQSSSSSFNVGITIIPEPKKLQCIEETTLEEATKDKDFSSTQCPNKEEDNKKDE